MSTHWWARNEQSLVAALRGRAYQSAANRRTGITRDHPAWQTLYQAGYSPDVIPHMIARSIRDYSDMAAENRNNLTILRAPRQGALLP